MNENISTLIDVGEMIGGKISFEQGFASFKRLSKEELEKLPEEERAYATTAMGRAVFQLGKDGKIINYKGVDSHFSNEEMGLIDKVGALPISYTRNNEEYVESNYPINLVLFLDSDDKLRADIRIRGASPLEDIEIESYLNMQMRKNGIKLPQIYQVKEFSEDFLEKNGLPQYVDGNFSEFESDYEEEDIARKAYLEITMGDRYKEQHIPGKRPERVSEYLKRIGLADDSKIREFLEKHGKTIEDFSDYVDNDYSRGQRYGQAIRKLESPFRIADLEILSGDLKNLPAIEAIVNFTESMHPDRIPFENYFAKQLGKNLGNMMNNGWVCENFSHRQDYSLTGEMCDDSYQYAPQELNKYYEMEKQGKKELYAAADDKSIDIGKGKIERAEAGKVNLRLKYFSQIYSLSSNIKVLQDEMKMRGKSKKEIESVLTDFLDSFTNTVDLDRASLNISRRPHVGKKALEILTRTPNNMAKLLAFSPKGPNGTNLEDEVIRSQSPFNAFFDEVSTGLAVRLNLDRTFINQTPRDVKGIRPYQDFGEEEMR